MSCDRTPAERSPYLTHTRRTSTGEQEAQHSDQCMLLIGQHVSLQACAPSAQRKPAAWLSPYRCTPGIGGIYGRHNRVAVHDAAEVEVRHLDPPVPVHQQVGRLQVPVQHWWLVTVQLQHALHNMGTLASETASKLIGSCLKIWASMQYDHTNLCQLRWHMARAAAWPRPKTQGQTQATC